MVSARVGLGGVSRSRRGRRGDGSKRLRPDGRSPPIVSDEDEDEGLEGDDDRYIGELHYQLSVEEHVGDIFPQLFVDPDTLDTRARLAGWNLEVIWSGTDGRYLARLTVSHR